MADLSIREYFVQGDTIGKLINEEAISICSKLTKAQIRTYLQNNRPDIWALMQGHTTELQMTVCPHDVTKSHYTLMLDRP